MIVTNLNPDGPGSLQEACAAEGPRIVVFEVSGVISNTIAIEHSKITLAGQTAPGAGITIEGMLVSKPGTADVVARFLRVRPRPVETVILPEQDGGGPLAVRLRKIGVEMKNPHENWYDEYDGVKMTQARNVVLDHLSCSWSDDELISLCETHHITVQWCALEETNLGKHTKYNGHHNFALFSAYNKAGFISIHHNLIANNSRRAPTVRDGMGDIRNNVIYNYRQGFTHDGGSKGPLNLVGNVFKLGPNSEKPMPQVIWWGSRVKTICLEKAALYHLADNRDFHDARENLALGEGRISERPFGMPAVTTQPAMEAYEMVLARAGAFPRDAVTRRTIEEVRDGTGAWGRREPEGGLMAGLTPGRAPKDADRDGMPDEWEKKNGLDPTQDDSAKAMPDGYTAVEVYLAERAETLVKGAGGDE
jgi:hypothetical protein